MTTLPDTELDALTCELAHPEGTVPNPRRNGKIARLPQASRDMLNRMLDDGLPYHVIIEELGEAGQGLNPQNITNWVRGGYQDYLRQQEAIDHAKAQVECALQLMQELGDVDLATIRRACNHVAALQLLQTLRDHGDETLKKMFQERPGKYLKVVHTLCHQSNAALKLEKFRAQQQLHLGAGTSSSPDGSSASTVACESSPPPSSPIKAIQAAAENRTNCNHDPAAPCPSI